ncbi:MAG: response regulator transcription factor [Microbacteriaceae bacterium]|nr:response regulator transcription factor [Microbacteriaceae bacterium]
MNSGMQPRNSTQNSKVHNPVQDSAFAPIRVMIVDDQKAVRYGFSMVINAVAGFEVVAMANDGMHALETLAEITENQGAAALPQVILMDIRMPNMNGIDATAEILRRYPVVKVLALTTYDQDDYAFKMLAAGASGFLLKDVRGKELVAAIAAVHAGDAVLTPRITAQVLKRSSGALQQAAGVDKSVFAELTDREIEVVNLVAQGLNNAEIAAELVIEPDSAKKAVSRILTKTGLRDRIHLAISWLQVTQD